MFCRACGVEAPTKYVSFHRIIGAFFVCRHRQVGGRLCKSCIHSCFWKFTAVNLFLGWWSPLSFFVTPFLMLNNIGRYLFSLSMPTVPLGAPAPELTAQAIERLKPHGEQMAVRLKAGEEIGRASCRERV